LLPTSPQSAFNILPFRHVITNKQIWSLPPGGNDIPLPSPGKLGALIGGIGGIGIFGIVVVVVVVFKVDDG